jgi:hypothetical protein
MAVVSVKEKHDRRRSSDRDGKPAHTRVYLVTCNDPHDGTAVALTANDGTNRVPRYGERIGNLIVTSVDADPVSGSAVHFEVQVELTSAENAEQEDAQIHPLSRPPEVSWGSNETTEPYFLDESPTPKPVVNSAGESFESFLERERGELVITASLNEPTHDAAAADTYSNTINQDAVTIDGTTYPAGTLKLSPITASRQVEDWRNEQGEVTRVVFYKRTYVFKVRAAGWNDKVLDVGYNELTGDAVKGWKLKPILDGASVAVRKPYPLDGTGKRKPKPTDKPAELEFKPYKVKSWSALPLFAA